MKSEGDRVEVIAFSVWVLADGLQARNSLMMNPAQPNQLARGRSSKPWSSCASVVVPAHAGTHTADAIGLATFFHNETFVVMGPCFRRDDIHAAAAHDA